MVGDNFRGENTVVTGWGKNQSSTASESFGEADILQVCISKTSKIISKNLSQEILLPITTSTQCNNIFADQLNITLVDAKVLCFGSGEANKGVCFGDSGGPLIVQKQGQSRCMILFSLSYLNFKSLL